VLVVPARRVALVAKLVPAGLACAKTAAVETVSTSTEAAAITASAASAGMRGGTAGEAQSSLLDESAK
jgi:hypothetical protein